MLCWPWPWPWPRPWSQSTTVGFSSRSLEPPKFAKFAYSYTRRKSACVYPRLPNRFYSYVFLEKTEKPIAERQFRWFCAELVFDKLVYTYAHTRTLRRCDYRIAVWNEISLTTCSALPNKCRVCQVRIWWTLYCSCNYLILDGFQNQSCSHYYFFVDIIILFSLRIRSSVLLVFQCDSSTRATWIKFR